MSNDDFKRGRKHGEEFERSDPGIVDEVVQDVAGMGAGMVAIGTDPVKYDKGFKEGREAERARRSEREAERETSSRQRRGRDASQVGSSSWSVSDGEPGPIGRLFAPFLASPKAVAAGYLLWTAMSYGGLWLANWIVSGPASGAWLIAIAIWIVCLPGVIVGLPAFVVAYVIFRMIGVF